MKNLSLVLATAIVASISMAAWGEDTPLAEQLKSLELPGNQAPSVVSKEKLYVVQTRYLPLRFKSEVSLGYAQNLTGDSFFNTRQAELGYRFHLGDRFSLGFTQSFVTNSMTSEGDNLLASEGIIPNMPYARQRSELTLGYNVFYGKFRLSSEQVFYFDQYVAVGPGLMMLNVGDFGAAVADVGFAFWLGQWGSTRIGLKDYIYSEPGKSSLSENLHAHLDVGYLF
jgi:outer membrane beta-barrel protein